MSRPEDRAPRLAKTSVVGSLPDNKEGRDEGRVSSAAYPLAVRVGHVMEWLDEHLPHRAMWLPGRRLICSAADTSYGWGPDATDWQAKATWLDRWIVRNLG